MINIEKIKENIKCPQFGDLEYGKWGALRLEQRIAYKELIEEIEKLNNNWELLKEYIKQLPSNEYIGYWKTDILEDIDKIKENTNGKD